jgi:hypothetical protein
VCKQSYIYENHESDEQLKGQSMNDQRRFSRIFFVLIFFGVMNLLHMISSPAWAYFRVVDVVRLIGTGMCFGAAIFSLVVYAQDRRSS